MMVTSIDRRAKINKCQKAILPSLLRHLGLGLFYLAIILPFRWQEVLGIVHLTPPHWAALFGTVFPWIGIVDLTAIGYACVRWVLSGFKIDRRDREFRTFIGVNILCVLWTWLRYVLGYEAEMFWDSALEIVRLCSLYCLYTSLSQPRVNLSRVLQNALLLLFLVTVLLFLIGFENENLQHSFYYRLNAPGLEVTSTGYIAAVLLLSGLLLSQGKRRLVIIVLGALGIVISGGRSALVLCPAFIGSLVLLRLFLRQRLRVRLILFLLVCGLTVGMLTLVSPIMGVADLPALARLLKGSSEMALEPTLAIVRASFPSLPVDSMPYPAALLGRLAAWGTGLQILQEVRASPLGSDWSIQTKQAALGYFTHTHSTYLQMLLKYGPLAFLIWIGMARSLWQGQRARSPYVAILVFLFLGWGIDYWMFVTKAAFVFFALLRLNNDWIIERSVQKRSEVRER